MIFIERRRSKRKEVEIEVDFVRFNDTKDAIQKGFIKNISEGGMCIETTFPLLVAQPVIVRYTATPSTIKYGIVCWTNKVDNRYIAGVRLLTKEKEEGS